MAIIVLQRGESATKEQIEKASEEHVVYVKLTVDLKREIYAIGGHLHSDAEKILIEKYGCKSDEIVGGGYKLDDKMYITNAMLNLRPRLNNPSLEILDQGKREKFLSIAKIAFKNVE